ncbi:hypothetical protein M23134_00377 [Microscilla marina ATCC 23134]|uniref:Uncharacterized protein n=1 Tax=Microscilla marina ATCC 23134 TaxID=313606 RepID=A1ZIV7_MICM2|nr:hypothetical protein M23134_00377 [Microscilla marina ATCC 23134]
MYLWYLPKFFDIFCVFSGVLLGFSRKMVLFKKMEKDLVWFL